MSQAFHDTFCLRYWYVAWEFEVSLCVRRLWSVFCWASELYYTLLNTGGSNISKNKYERADEGDSDQKNVRACQKVGVDHFLNRETYEHRSFSILVKSKF